MKWQKNQLIKIEPYSGEQHTIVFETINHEVIWFNPKNITVEDAFSLLDFEIRSTESFEEDHISIDIITKDENGIWEGVYKVPEHKFYIREFHDDPQWVIIEQSDILAFSFKAQQDITI